MNRRAQRWASFHKHFPKNRHPLAKLAVIRQIAQHICYIRALRGSSVDAHGHLQRQRCQVWKRLQRCAKTNNLEAYVRLRNSLKIATTSPRLAPGGDCTEGELRNVMHIEAMDDSFAHSEQCRHRLNSFKGIYKGII